MRLPATVGPVQAEELRCAWDRALDRTLATEWAYAYTYLSDEARAATYTNWLHSYSHH